MKPPWAFAGRHRSGYTSAAPHAPCCRCSCCRRHPALRCPAPCGCEAPPGSAPAARKAEVGRAWSWRSAAPSMCSCVNSPSVFSARLRSVVLKPSAALPSTASACACARAGACGLPKPAPTAARGGQGASGRAPAYIPAPTAGQGGTRRRARGPAPPRCLRQPLRVAGQVCGAWLGWDLGARAKGEGRRAQGAHSRRRCEDALQQEPT